MNNTEENKNVRQAVLKAMFDLTNENRSPPEVHMPTRDELAGRAGIGRDEAAYALEYLTAKGLVKPEKLGEDGSPNYSITTHGINTIESTLEVVETSPREERL